MRPLDKHEIAQLTEEGQAIAEEYMRTIIANHVIRKGVDSASLAEALRRQAYVLSAAANWLMNLARDCEGG